MLEKYYEGYLDAGWPWLPTEYSVSWQSILYYVFMGFLVEYNSSELFKVSIIFNKAMTIF
jgi:hypothetical protein